MTHYVYALRADVNAPLASFKYDKSPVHLIYTAKENNNTFYLSVSIVYDTLSFSVNNTQNTFISGAWRNAVDAPRLK